MLRNGLRTPNVSPKKYWENVNSKVMPIRGTSLLLSHICGSEGPNPSVIRLLHDSTNHVTTKMLLTRNNGKFNPAPPFSRLIKNVCPGITTKLEQKLVINEHTLEKDGWHVNVDAGFESAKTVQ